jgi:hypothetical protein
VSLYKEINFEDESCEHLKVHVRPDSLRPAA